MEPAALRRHARRLRTGLGLLCFSAALFGIHAGLEGQRYHEILRSLAAMSAAQLGAAAGFVAASYVALGLGDALAFRFAKHPLGASRIALSSFVSNAFTNSVGLLALGGVPVRLRFLGAWGFSAPEVLVVTLFSSLTRLVGFLALGGALCVGAPLALPAVAALPFATARPLGVVLLLLLGGYLAASLWRAPTLRIGGSSLTPPTPSLALAQVAVSSLDWACSAAALFCLLGETSAVSFLSILDAFLLAQALGYLSSVPGGLGVFEGALLLLLPASVTPLSAAGALLAFRGLYYLAPLALASLALGAQELVDRGERLSRSWARLEPRVVPEIFALSTFAAGTILLFSGSTPAAAGRLATLHDLLPLPVVELSHFLASLTGVALLVLSRGLHQRLDAAWAATVGLLGWGALFSLAKGLDYEEALLLGAMLTALLPCRRHFHRRSTLQGLEPDASWLIAIAVVVAATVWLTAFSQRYDEYGSRAWWEFAFESEAPRSLRAAVGAAVAAGAIGLARLLGPAREYPLLPSEEELGAARSIAAASTKTYANLVLRRDKAILFSADRKAFLMYGIFDRSCVAMGDPVGDPAQTAELVWRFRELSDRSGRWPVFFEVQPAYAGLYLDAGLGLLKLGEAARVPLRTFTLDGPERAGLRRSSSRAARAGCCFEIVERAALDGLLPELRRVSDAWLAEKTTREKGFSNAAFSEDYVAAFPAALVRRHGRILAFANLWLGAAKEELSVDLMRFLPGAPPGVMDYLFTELMAWGRAQGFEWFDLGMAPLSGLDSDPASPIWSKLATFTFRHGEHFYNFQGLRRYKAKFLPEWEPRFLASPGGLALPRILVDVAALIAGGLTGILKK
jgi:phosphatidylglycerol lysyltransferase